MPRPLVSVVMASFDRIRYLTRSLECYRRQEFDNTAFELVVVDDHSQDGTRDSVLRWSKDTGIKASVITTAPKGSYWRDCGAVLNAGIRASSGDYVLLTHPEVMPGRKSVGMCWNHLCSNDFAYASCKVYYMGRRDQELIDTVPWQDRGNLAARDIPGFYAGDDNGNPDYRHDVTDKVATPGFRIKSWDSWVFGGCSRRTWKRLGGMLETSEWGSVDVAFMERRRSLGLGNFTCPDDDTTVIHQNHDGPDDVKTPREAGAWQRELRGFDLRNPSKLVYPAVDNLGW